MITSDLNSLLATALSLHHQGRIQEAASHYAEILWQDPNHFEALHMLGMAHLQVGQNEKARQLISQALTIRQDPLAFSNLGFVLNALNRHEQALQCFDQALRLRPDYAEAWNNRGIALVSLERVDEAVQSYERALAINPQNAEALSNCGLALATRKRFAAALECCDRALALKPDFAEALNNRGIALAGLRRFDEAIDSSSRALAVKPDYADVLYNRGLVLFELRRFDEALTSYAGAIALKPDFVGALNNQGVALAALRRFDEALASYDSALALKPEFAEAWTNRGVALADLGRFDEALASHDQALTLRREFAEAHFNRGNALKDQQRLDEALDSYAHALALQPDFAEAHFSNAFCLLLQGNFELGWKEFEWRWKTGRSRVIERQFSEPRWTGEQELRGKTILLYDEQGLGDTIQFCRYAKLVAARGARVVLEVPGALVRSLRALDGVDVLVEQGQSLPAFDLHCPLLSLPLAFGTSLETIPQPTAYLFAEPEKVLAWRERASGAARRRVGLAWSGNPAHKNDPHRSMPLATILEALPPGFSAVSLQKEVRDSDQAVLETNPRISDHSPMLSDFSDTAALIAQTDLVIAVDSSVAHLAAAMGKTTWLLLPYAPDWRWLTGRTDSPWYSTMRLFRQPAYGDWGSVIAEVRRALAEQ